MKEYACCFTGHRIIALRDKAALIKDLETVVETLAESGVNRFICGGALGFDTLSAQAILKAKEKYPHIILSLVLPCRDQAARWTESQKKLYNTILEKADEKEFLFDRYVKGCMQMRNRRMVDASQVCVAYYQGKPGGTAQTVAYAKEKGVHLLFLPVKEAIKWEI